MSAYLIRRIIQMVVVLFISGLAIFLILQLAPGGPLSGINMGLTGKDKFSQADIDNIKRSMGLNKPLPVRLVAWWVGDDWMASLKPEWAGENRGILRGDLGRSWKQKDRTVWELFQERLPVTIALMSLSFLFSFLIAVPIAILSAVRQYSKLDYAFTFFTFIGTAIPSFWFGLMSIIVFHYQFKKWGLPFLPSSGIHSVRSVAQQGSLLDVLNIQKDSLPDYLVFLIMPVAVLSLRSMAGWGRYVRSSMLEVLKQDYVRTARAKGLTERVVIAKHALRNGLIPLATIITFEIPAIFGGAILIESVFGIPGMGRLFIERMGAADWPVVQGFLIITALLTVIATLLSDILYTIVDPRIRFA